MQYNELGLVQASVVFLMVPHAKIKTRKTAVLTFTLYNDEFKRQQEKLNKKELRQFVQTKNEGLQHREDSLVDVDVS